MSNEYVKIRPTLKEILETIRSKVGVLRIPEYEYLRNILRIIKIEEFVQEVKEIDDIELLRLLWGAGLDRDQQHVVLKRIEELTR